jgi:hypothetical protein
VYVCSHSPCLFWPVTYSSMGSHNFDDRYSEHFALMPSIPIRTTTEPPYRSEWDSRTTRWFNITMPTVVSLFQTCDPSKLITRVAGFVRQYRVRSTKLDEWGCKFNTGRWVIHLRDIDLTETSCKSSWLPGYMPCINDLKRYWYFL